MITRRYLLLCLSWFAITAVIANAQIPFTEEAASRGVVSYLYTGSVGFGRGLALNDLDGDGDLDIALTGDLVDAVLFFDNQGDGTFLPVAATCSPPAATYNAISTADFDGDQDLDLYVSNFSGANLLLRNDGPFTFTNVGDAAGVADTSHSLGTTWGDYDGDGWVDLYVANRGPFLDENNRLYRNLGDGTFEDVSTLLGAPELGPSFQGVFFDYDRDSDVDLFLTNDKGPDLGTNCRLWRNDGGTMVDVSSTSAAGVFAHAMGVGVGDPNRDGFLDLSISNTLIAGQNLLLVNEGTGTFVDASVEFGVADGNVGWATEFFDYDNDGYEDLFTVDGDSSTANALYHGSAVLPLLNIANALDLDLVGRTYCATPGDVDGDGDLDLVVSTTDGPLAIYINHEGETRHWIAIELSSSTPNTRAIGAIVDVHVDGATLTRAVLGSGSYKNSNPYTLHFGLGDHDVVDSITVHWPNGPISLHGPFDADQQVTLDDSDPLEPLFIRGDVNSDGSFDVADPILGLSHLFFGATISCARALDTNDDDVLNVADTVFALTALFGGAPPLDAPHPTCGVDPTSSLGCVSGCPL